MLQILRAVIANGLRTLFSFWIDHADRWPRLRAKARRDCGNEQP
jgi:hypothetical protein